MSDKIKVLENGITLICHTNRRSKIGEIAVGVRAGSINENEKRLQGISHVLEHMFFKGTTSRTYKEINESIENTGAETNAFTDYDKTCFYITSKMTDFDDMTEILFDMFCNPSFPEEELEKEKEVIRQELMMYEDDPDSKSCMLSNEVSFKGTPMEHDIGGTWETVKDLTVEDLRQYRKENYTANRIFVSAFGNVTMEHLEDLVRKYMTNIQPSKEYVPVKIKTSYGNSNTTRRDISQAHVVWTVADFNRTKPEAYKMALFNEIFSNGMSSKLFMRIREEMGLVYTISSAIQPYGKNANMGIFALCDEDKIDVIKENIDLLIEEMKEGKFSDKEFLKAKNSQEIDIMKNDLAPLGYAMKNLCSFISLGRLRNSKRNLKIIQSITKEDLIEFANKMFKKEKFNFAAVLPDETNC